MIRMTSSGDPSSLAWFKSSYSDGPEGDSCVEVALTWGTNGESCLEIAPTPATIHVRDSKYRTVAGPRLALAPAAWAPFVAYASGD
ncbi:DUF397 domain-containing protein [Streptomyces sp. NPDC001068]|uniref:DUF397 domain-containing protein n=1 Tax=Streptomyces sp. NPDC001068 TaxID=3364544 RepID=UPI00368C5681